MCLFKIVGLIYTALCFIFACLTFFFVGGMLRIRSYFFPTHLKGFYWRFWILSGKTSLKNGGAQWLSDHVREAFTIDGLFVGLGFASIGIFIGILLLVYLLMYLTRRLCCTSEEERIYRRLKEKKKFAKWTSYEDAV